MSGGLNPDDDALFIRLSHILEACCEDKQCDSCEKQLACHRWFNYVSNESSERYLRPEDVDKALASLRQSGILQVHDKIELE